jgi:hypothetical protein
MKSIHVKLENSVSGFSDDKDKAKSIRVNTILPAIENHQRVVLDFSGVTYSTQSYVHALIGEALQKYKAKALDQLEFKGCSPQLRSLVEMVVDYSLGGFATPPQPPDPIKAHPLRTSRHPARAVTRRVKGDTTKRAKQRKVKAR